ncbi:MAG TPA: DUF4262 domain-containing protein [Mycobacteriales bacterium]|nr:DUF4262 domain-containing protein [Mycobacteriales bacterium]
MNEAQIQAWLDQEDRHTSILIRKYGWALQHVCGGPDDIPSAFAYTIGLFGFGHPELVVLGLPTAMAGSLLNHLGDRVRGGNDLVPGELLSFPAWPHRVIVEELPNPGDVVLAANRHYGHPPFASVPAYQLTYDDEQGRFPWEDEYAGSPNAQPRPGRWSA